MYNQLVLSVILTFAYYNVILYALTYYNVILYVLTYYNVILYALAYYNVILYALTYYNVILFYLTCYGGILYLLLVIMVFRILLLIIIVFYILFRQQVNRHEILPCDFFLQNQMVAQGFDAVEPLQGGLLGDEEEDAPLFQAVHVTFQQVISHEVEIRSPVLLQIFADDICFGVEGDAVLYGGVGTEEVIQHLRVLAVAFGVQVQFPDTADRVMLAHVFPETDFPPFLLVGAHDAFVYLAEDNDFLRILAGEQHQHACGEISALVRVLSEEGEGGSFLDVRVYIYKVYSAFRARR